MIPPYLFRQVAVDPSVSGLAGAVGDVVCNAAGTAAWVRSGAGLTDWTPFPAGPGPAQGVNLTDASSTINPGTDRASLYTMPAGTTTANRTKTLGTGGSPATKLVVQVVVRPQANTVAFVDDAATSIVSFASAAYAQGATLSFDGTHFVLVNTFFPA